jgi:C4-dicarboxylate-specific signal transduction histidine kinase
MTGWSPLLTARRTPALLVFAAAIAVVVAGAVVAQQLAANALESRARESSEVTASVAAIAVEQNARRLTELVVLTARRPELAAAIRRDDRAKQQEIATALARTSPSIRIAFVVSADGFVRAMSPRDPKVIGRSYRFRDWYRGVTRRSPYVSEVYRIAAFDRPRAITIAANVPGEHGRAGIVTVVQETRAFERVVATIGRTRGRRISILDQRGRLVTGPTIPAAAQETVAAARALGTATAHTGSGQDGRFFAAAALPETGWIVLSDTPARIALGDLPELRWVVIAFAVLTLVCLAGLGGAYVRMRRRVEVAERAELRHRQAFEINDAVVQRLVVAKMALDLGRDEEAKEAIAAALDSGSDLITRLADGDALTRSTAATTEDGR